MTPRISRRSFTQATAAASFALSAAQTGRVLGANDRVRLGFIGVANRGGQLLSAFRPHADMEVVALCDVHQPTLEKAAQRLDNKPRRFADFRKLLDDKDIDAVVIATPDHWHALQTIAACRAGKDVYVEKPLSMTIREGRRMVEVARQTKRVVQVGLHRRSSKLYAEAASLIRSGKLGKVTLGRAYHVSNMYPLGMGKAKPSQPPEGLDWDLWLGPRPMRPYQDNITPYKFRWWDFYSSQVANQGVHFLDVIRWLTGDEAPRSVCAMGGRYVVEDDRTIPDTMECNFELNKALAVLGVYESSGNPVLPRKGFVEMRGTQGTLYAGDRSFEVLPESGGQFQDRKPRMKPAEVKATDGDLTEANARNFLDCIKSRAKPNADVEIGHRSTTFSHLANISLAVRARLDWDPVKETVTNCPEATELLHYEYRKPWTLD